jgi:hypothetical protein
VYVETHKIKTAVSSITTSFINNLKGSHKAYKPKINAYREPTEGIEIVSVSTYMV